ncbi:MAG TPA: DUF3089 domain-containing protein [Caulobacteraceae bacterium]
MDAGRRRWGGLGLGLALTAGAMIVLAIAVALIWRDDILGALLDPKIPYAVYRRPPAPDYAKTDAWALLPGRSDDGPAPPADVFFIHPTTFDGGDDWNGPVSDHGARALLAKVMLPNYAGPFATTARVFAPRYRQASLYTSLSLFDDAVEAREFAYGDVAVAFRFFLDHLNVGRPVIIVGVEQGGLLAARLVREEIAQDRHLLDRLAAVYLIETAVPAQDYGPDAVVPACLRRIQARCVVGWVSVRRGDFVRAQRLLNRALVWNAQDALVGLAGRRALCVNPLLGAVSDADAPARLNLGAANATGMEWGAKPGFMVRQVGAQCVGGVLRVTKPRSASLRPAGGWAERRRVAGYNLFYADLEADSRARVLALLGSQQPRAAPSKRQPRRPRS